MTGHEVLQAMRRAGRVPRAVWITDGDDIRARDWHEEPNYADMERHAVISIAASDIPEALDFRCLVGLEVHIAGQRGESRARRLHDAAAQAEARIVVTTIHGHAPELLVHGFGVPAHG